MDLSLLELLLDNQSVSGNEIPLQKKLITAMEPYCDKIMTDYTGNVICAINPDAPFKVMLDGHIDEIGLIVTHIQSDGLLKVTTAGGVRLYTYPGSQVVIQGEKGPVYGCVISNKSLSKEFKVTDLAIDIGAKDDKEAREYVAEGDPVSPRTFRTQLLGGRLCARALDDKTGVFIVMEALKRARDRGCSIGVYASSSVGEENTGRGAHWAGSAIDPDVAIAVDVTYAQDYPGCDPTESGNVKLGAGPVICNSSMANKKLNKLLKACAEQNSIPTQIESFPGRTGTDADKIHFVGSGVVTGLLSLPLRYMHSHSEVCDLKDVEDAIELLAQLLCTINENTDLDPFK